MENKSIMIRDRHGYSYKNNEIVVKTLTAINHNRTSLNNETVFKTLMEN